MNDQHKDTTKKQKVSYVSPELKIYGTISELTHAGAGNTDDLGGGSFTLFSDTLPPTGVN
jgi:hypothetical protein